MRCITVVCMMAFCGISGVAADEKSDLKAGDTKTVDVGGDTKMAFVWCPPGEFLMGISDSETPRGASETPQHTVTFKQGFWIGKCEVTQDQWKSVTGENPSHFKGSPNLPVEQVSWDDCQQFLRKLNTKSGGTFRLPCEAEWEYACRAGTRTPFAFGESISTEQVNYKAPFNKGVARERTTEVGLFPGNAWNLCDMHGNVHEWCQDWYHDSYTDSPADGSAWESPANTDRVLRGGSWSSSQLSCRSAARGHYTPDSRLITIGFRIVCGSLPR